MMASPSTDIVRSAWEALASRLTPAQRETAMRPRSALVLEGAGTGKTSTLTASVVHKIQVEKLAASRLLVGTASQSQPAPAELAIADFSAGARQKGYVGYSCLDCGNFMFVRSGAPRVHPFMEAPLAVPEKPRRRREEEEKRRRDRYRIAVARRKGADAEPLRWARCPRFAPLQRVPRCDARGAVHVQEWRKDSPMKKLRHDVARRDHYEELTNTIIAKLEDGVLPWRRPWDPKKCAGGASPMNPVTGRTYRGVNALALAMSPRAFGGDPRWMSYRQAAARGWQVRKGEKGAIVFFYKKLEIRSDDEDRRTIPLLRAYVVFHASQLDGIPELGEPEAPKPVDERIADADLIVKASGIRVETGGDRAFYAPSTDHIEMPPDRAFASPPDWAATILHELAHASGAPHRLNRDLTGRFGDTAYSREELRAELASLFVGSALGLPSDVPNHTSYIQSWVKVLKDDKREIFRAAADANRMAEWILPHQDARHRLWQPMPDFPSLAALNDWLETRCRELWAQTLHGSQPGAIGDVWAEEVGRLMQLSRPFDGFVEYAKRVSPTCLVHLDRNRYSVPASFANRPVSLRVYPERIVVVAEGQIVCEHRRVFARSHERKSTTTVYDWRHYLAVIQRKPGALRNGAPFVELPPAFRALQQRMLKTPGGDREMVEILALVLQHDEQAVPAAVELAPEAGAPTKTHILNLLHRLVDGKPTDTPTIKAPQALTLTTEPRADVERYDALRKVREARHAS